MVSTRQKLLESTRQKLLELDIKLPKLEIIPIKKRYTYIYSTLEILLWLLSLFILIIIVSFTNLYAHMQHTDKYMSKNLTLHERRLPDIGFKITEIFELHAIFPTAFIEVIIPLGFALVTLCIGLYKAEFDRCRRCLLIIFTMYLMRCISVCLTVLPDPYELCFQLSDDILSKDYITIVINLISNHLFDLPNMCGTCFFSGHSALLVIVLIEWMAIFDNFMISLPVIIMVGLEIYCMFCEGFHYTLDIMTGILIGFSLEQIFPFSLSYAHIKGLAELGMFRVQSRLSNSIHNWVQSLNEWGVDMNEINIAIAKMPNIMADALALGEVRDMIRKKIQEIQHKKPEIVRAKDSPIKSRSRSVSRAAKSKTT